MAALRVLAVAVASGRAGYVLLRGNELIDWGVAQKATRSGSELVGYVQKLIGDLKPDVVVTERCDETCRKGGRSRRLIQAVAALASHNGVLDVSVRRPREHASKYEEAAAFAARFPDVRGYLPKRKRRIFDFEPKGLIIFEALALAEAVRRGPPEALAAAMG
ncbi:MAG: hypothetical protein AAF360_14910 [Pseudomonadota bacterium]